VTSRVTSAEAYRRYNRDKHRRRRARFLAQGLCASCGRRPHRPNRQTCEICGPLAAARVQLTPSRQQEKTRDRVGQRFRCSTCGWSGFVTSRPRCKACDRRRKREWRQANPQKHRQSQRRWTLRPNGRMSQQATRSRRRARLAGVPHESINIQEVYEACGYICGICHEFVPPEQRSLDHIVPLARGGAHIRSNVQLAHRRCNSRKGTRASNDVVTRQLTTMID